MPSLLSSVQHSNVTESITPGYNTAVIVCSRHYLRTTIGKDTDATLVHRINAPSPKPIEGDFTDTTTKKDVIAVTTFNIYFLVDIHVLLVQFVNRELSLNEFVVKPVVLYGEVDTLDVDLY